MYAVVISQLFNNNMIDIQTFKGFPEASAHRNDAVKALCKLYPQEGFLVQEPVTVGYTTVSTELSDGTFKTWMVIKTQELKVK